MSELQTRLVDRLKQNNSLLTTTNQQNTDTPISVEKLSNLLENFSLDLDSNSNKMDVQAFAHLLPTFNGNSDHLEHFITCIEDFHKSFSNTSEIQKKYVFSTIKSKLKDEAHNLLYCRSDLTNWEDLKNALRQKFGDPISFLVLLHQLNYFNRNKNENIMDFILRLKQFLQRIFAKIQTEQANENVRSAFRYQTEKTAIITLMSNSPDILKSYLLTTNPDTLDQAISCITNYNLVESQVTLRNQLNRHNIDRNMPSITNNQNNQNNHIMQKTNFPSQPLNLQPRQIHHKFPSNIPAFRQQKTNVFSPQRNTNFPKPTPMSVRNTPIDNPGATGTQSMRTYRPNNFQKAPSQNYNHFQNVGHNSKYSFQELTNLECDEPPYETSAEEEDYDYSNDRNFLDLPDMSTSENSEKNPENFMIPAFQKELT